MNRDGVARWNGTLSSTPPTATTRHERDHRRLPLTRLSILARRSEAQVISNQEVRTGREAGELPPGRHAARWSRPHAAVRDAHPWDRSGWSSSSATRKRLGDTPPFAAVRNSDRKATPAGSGRELEGCARRHCKPLLSLAALRALPRGRRSRRSRADPRACPADTPPGEGPMGREGAKGPRRPPTGRRKIWITSAPSLPAMRRFPRPTLPKTSTIPS